MLPPVILRSDSVGLPMIRKWGFLVLIRRDVLAASDMARTLASSFEVIATSRPIRELPLGSCLRFAD
eukprot:4247239-Alexandrium_andersonii.AAC.1